MAVYLQVGIGLRKGLVITYLHGTPLQVSRQA